MHIFKTRYFKRTFSWWCICTNGYIMQIQIFLWFVVAENPKVIRVNQTNDIHVTGILTFVYSRYCKVFIVGHSASSARAYRIPVAFMLATALRIVCKARIWKHWSPWQTWRFRLHFIRTKISVNHNVRTSAFRGVTILPWKKN